MKELNFDMCTMEYSSEFYIRQIYAKQGSKISRNDKFMELGLEGRSDLNIDIYFKMNDEKNLPIETASIIELNIIKGQKILISNVFILARISICAHPFIYERFCIKCNTFVPIGNNDVEMVQCFFNNHRVLISEELSFKNNNEHIDRLHKQKKLALVLDLDRTILHTAERNKFITSNKEAYEFLKEQQKMNGKGKIKNLFFFEVDHCSYVVKFRPFIKKFLKRMHSLFELYVYTHGTRSYADTILKMIDVDGKYFNGRVVTADENFIGDEKLERTKDLRRIFPESNEMVLVLDDNQEVWQGCENLIKIYPFTFWRRDFKEEFDLPISMDRIIMMRSLYDNILLYVGDFLEKIHTSYYSFYSRSLENISSLKSSVLRLSDNNGGVLYGLQQERKKIFDGMNIFFYSSSSSSSCSSVTQKRKDEEIHFFEDLLVGVFGGECSIDLNDNVTHIIAPKSFDIQRGISVSSNVKMVNPFWLFDCIVKWGKLEEDNYPVTENKDLNENERRYLFDVLNLYMPINNRWKEEDGVIDELAKISYDNDDDYDENGEIIIAPKRKFENIKDKNSKKLKK